MGGENKKLDITRHLCHSYFILYPKYVFIFPKNHSFSLKQREKKTLMHLTSGGKNYFQKREEIFQENIHPCLPLEGPACV